MGELHKEPIFIGDVVRIKGTYTEKEWVVVGLGTGLAMVASRAQLQKPNLFGGGMTMVVAVPTVRLEKVEEPKPKAVAGRIYYHMQWNKQVVGSENGKVLWFDELTHTWREEAFNPGVMISQSSKE